MMLKPSIPATITAATPAVTAADLPPATANDLPASRNIQAVPMFIPLRTVAATSLAGLLWLSATLPARAETIQGQPRIVDGDTVEISGKKLRLQGIDAPETDQLCLDAKGEKWACGVASRDALSGFSKNRPWACDVSGKDKYDRFLASCSIGSENINQWMVRHGWALAFVKYSDRYLDDEPKARDAKAGLWSGAFIAPWGWRSRSKQSAIFGALSVPTNAQKILLDGVSAQEAPDPACTIKAGVHDGECIYHLTGDRWYAKMKMDKPDRRWFCSEQEAEVAGCRAPKR